MNLVKLLLDDDKAFTKTRKEIVLISVFPKIGVGPPKSSIRIGFSLINHPFWGTPNFWKHSYNIACSLSSFVPFTDEVLFYSL